MEMVTGTSTHTSCSFCRVIFRCLFPSDRKLRSAPLIIIKESCADHCCMRKSVQASTNTHVKTTKQKDDRRNHRLPCVIIRDPNTT